MPEKPLNPYAVTCTDIRRVEHNPFSDRASEEILRKVVKLMLITETNFISSWGMVIASEPFNTLGEFDFARVMQAAGAMLLTVAWFAALALMLITKSKALWAWLIMPIPLIGLIPLVGCINDARRFLLRNGYRPGVFGSRPDEEEIAAMAADPDYVPSVSNNRDGSYRSLPYPLTLTAFAITLLASVTLVVVSTVTMAC